MGREEGREGGSGARQRRETPGKRKDVVLLLQRGALFADCHAAHMALRTQRMTKRAAENGGGPKTATGTDQLRCDGERNQNHANGVGNRAIERVKELRVEKSVVWLV